MKRLPKLNSKVYYLHIPKTAGTVLNGFLQEEVASARAIEHIESNREVLKAGRLSESYDFVSGHFGYEVIREKIDGFSTVVTMREPLQHVLSHLTYVREIGSNEKRYKQHPLMIRNIVDKLQTVDFSRPEELEALIDWLESKKYFLFHNVLTVYMTRQPKGRRVDERELERALRNIESIDYVGLQERLGEFMLMLSYRLGISLDRVNEKKLNVTSNRYGLDITDVQTVQVLERLIDLDRVLYDKAKKMFADQFFTFLKEADLAGHKEFIYRYCEMVRPPQMATATDNCKSVQGRWTLARWLRR